tara:strand:- start:25740 stop:25988 length:249 start_codon:yes stop_codon:yes gene_type:complete
MSWEDTLQKYLGMNSIIDLIARVKENLSEMEAMTRESFGTTAQNKNVEFDTQEAKDILSDFDKFTEAVRSEWQKLIERGELQ